MNIPYLDPVSLASLIGAGALALTRLLTTAKPVWDRLPPSLQGLLPALVLVLPQIAAAALGVHTSLDLVNLIALSVALILPGVHSHTVALVKPSGPSSGVAGLMLVVGLCLPLQACALFSKVNWGGVEACAIPAETTLAQIVNAVLAGNGNVEAELTAIAEDYGYSAVKCAVQQIVGDLGKEPATAEATRKVVRGKAFLAKVAQ